MVCSQVADKTSIFFEHTMSSTILDVFFIADKATELISLLHFHYRLQCQTIQEPFWLFKESINSSSDVVSALIFIACLHTNPSFCNSANNQKWQHSLSLSTHSRWHQTSKIMLRQEIRSSRLRLCNATTSELGSVTCTVNYCTTFWPQKRMWSLKTIANVMDIY